MPETLASRACETCRKRRVKCDKRLPGCARCDKFGQPCSGYRTARRFLDDGAKIRQKYSVKSPSIIQNDEELSSNYTNEATCKADRQHSRPKGDQICNSSWPTTLSQPGLPFPQSHFSSGNTRNLSSAATTIQSTPYVRPQNSQYPVTNPSPTLQQANPWQAAMDPDLSLEASGNAFDTAPFATLLGDPQDFGFWDDVSVDTSVNSDFFDLDLEEYYANGNNACGFIPGVPVILSDEQVEPDELGGTVLSSPARHKEPAANPEVSNELISGDVIEARRHETAGLLKHFVEFVAPWMDVFDLDEYFTRVVPLKASRNAMIRSAVAAVVAKKMAQDVSHHDSLGTIAAINSNKQHQLDWFYKAASYYDKGLSQLRYCLQQWSKTVNSESVTQATDRTTLENFTGNPLKKRRLQSTRGTEMEDLLSAISVLNLYESFDNRQLSSQHSDGFQSLLTKAVASSGPQQQGEILSVFGSRRGGRAAFWNFALEDIAAAYSRNTTTRLDPGKFELFKIAGLSTDHDLITGDPNSARNQDLVDNIAGEREDVVAYSLVWLTMRVVNYIAPQNFDVTLGAETNKASLSTGPVGDRSNRRSEWEELRRALNQWFDNIPPTFEPYASIPLHTPKVGTEPEFVKLFFSIPICAAAVHLYHFARILLTLNEPTVEDAVTPARRLRAFRQASESSIFHARQICNIALGSPPSSVQRQMLHSLHLAGLCFEENVDRSIVLDLLQTIETNTGCSTMQIIEQLKSEWG